MLGEEILAKQSQLIEGAHQSVVALGSFGAHRHHFVAQGRGLRGALPCVRFVCSGRDELIVLWTYGALEPYSCMRYSTGTGMADPKAP